jgi:hypothetical protein
VALRKLQRGVLGVFAKNRDPESFVAGGLVLNRDWPRFSKHLDIFHDRQDRLIEAANADVTALLAAGFEAEWVRRLESVHSAIVRRQSETTSIDWVWDSDYRFFPAVPDAEFGFALHPVDLATNKVAAAISRREPRDAIDLLSVHMRLLPLGAVIWAACDKSPGWTPEGMIEEIRFTSLRYHRDDFALIDTAEPVDADQFAKGLRAALADAETFVSRMPTDKAGLLFLEDGKPVQPDPARLGDYVEHRAQRRGQWPSSPEINHAMIERYLGRT